MDADYPDWYRGFDRRSEGVRSARRRASGSVRRAVATPLSVVEADATPGIRPTRRSGAQVAGSLYRVADSRERGYIEW